METIQYFLPIITAILGFFISLLFKRVKTIEVIKEIPIEIIKLVEVNQCQVGEIVTEDNFQYIIAWDYYNRKQVITKKYTKGMLDNFKNGDIFQYLNSSTQAELIFDTVSVA